MEQGRGPEVHVAPERPVRYLVATALLALLAVPTLAVLLGSAYRPAPRIEQARTDLRVIESAVELHRARHGDECPASLEALVEDGILSGSARLEDPWGGRFWLVCRAEPEVVVGAAGPDGVPFTADDVRTDIPTTARYREPRVERLVLLLFALVAADLVAQAVQRRRRRRLLEALLAALAALGHEVERPRHRAPRRIWATLPGAEAQVEASCSLLTGLRLSVRRWEPRPGDPAVAPGPAPDLAEALRAAGPRWAFRLDDDLATASSRDAAPSPARLAAALRALALLVGAPLDPCRGPYR